MRRANQRLGIAFHFRALHQLNLSAVKIDVVFAVNRALGDVKFSSKNHFAAGEKRRRRLINEPGLDKQSEADGQNWNPPAAKQQSLVAMQPGDERSGPGGGNGSF